jgi:nitronate monooxygenase/enoyl-[acyl-carrier protein] reductase II
VTVTTSLCGLIGIEHPVIQGPLGGPWDVGAELIAAVSNAGGLGSIATSLRDPEEVRTAIRRVRELAGERPFAVNLTRRRFDDAVFEAALAERPAVVSLALGDPADLPERAHAAGCLFMEQVTTVTQALEAAEAGVDVIVAQGGEGGGFSGSVGTLALVPQVVDAVAPIPVVAAGGIVDGRGLAAAIALGAQGVNVGTRFLASTESHFPESWKQAIVAAESEDAIKVEFAHHLVPPVSEGGWLTIPRSLRTPFVDEWTARRDEAAQHADALREEFAYATASGRAHEYLPLAGQSAGAVKSVLPAAEIVQGIVREAAEALRASSGALAPQVHD